MKIGAAYLADEDVDDHGAFVLNTTYNLDDPRFGSDCQICSPKKCPGHFAILNLGVYIVHPMFESDVKRVVDGSCLECGSTLLVVNSKLRRCGECEEIVRSGIEILDRDLDVDRRKMSILAMREHTFIISKVLIPPPSIRPSSSPNRSNDLAIAYNDLVGAVKAGNKIRSRRKNLFRLYKRVVGLIVSMLSGKDGIFRSLMLGKRLNMSARSVIVPDTSIDVDEIHVPKLIVNNMRVSERCSVYNVSRLKAMASEGKVYWHGSDATMDPTDIVVGQVYERRVVDGDRVLFNRQPTLSRESIMSFRVKTRRDDTLAIGVNPIVTIPYNADFDGDEMNMYGGFDEMGQAEMVSMCDVKLHDGIQPIMDVITGAYEMTKPGTLIDVETYMNAIVAIDCPIPVGFDRHETPFMTGWDMIKLCLPLDLCIDDLIHHRADKHIIRTTIPERIVRAHLGPGAQREVANFYESLQRVVLQWFQGQGFGVNLSDCGWDDDDRKKRDELVSGIRMDRHFFADCSSVGDWAHKLCDEKYESSALHPMIKSGGKGNITMMAQMMGMAGYQHGAASSSNGGSLLERGYVSSSFYEGLSPNEYMRHARTARAGLMGTGTSTSSSGYKYRSLALLTSGLERTYLGDVTEGDKIISFGRS